MSFTKIQLKRTSGNKTLDDSTVKTIVPAYGEPVFSHTSTIDELVIGDGSTDIEHLPRLTLKGSNAFARISDITNAIGALDVSSVGGSGKYISAISQTDGKISATATNIPNYAVSDSVGGNATYVKEYGTGIISTDKDFNLLVDTRQYNNGLAVGAVDNAVSGLPTGMFRTNVKKDNTDTIVNVMIGKSTTNDGIGQITLGGKTYKATITPSTLTGDITITLPAASGTLATVGGDLGVATATTATAGDNSTKVATTSFVNTAISNNTKVVLPTSQPSSPAPGQLYIDNGMLKYNAGTAQNPNWQNVKSIGVWG